MLGIGLLETHRQRLRRRLTARLGQHRRREVDAGDAVTAARQFEAQKPGAAAGIERVERAAAADHQIEDAVPGGALGIGADAVAEIGIEPGGPPAPMGRDLLLNLIGLRHAHVPHFSPVSSARASSVSP